MGADGDEFPRDESRLPDDKGLKEEPQRGFFEQSTPVIHNRLHSLTKVPHFDHAVDLHVLATTSRSEPASSSSYVSDCGKLLKRAAKLCL